MKLKNEALEKLYGIIVNSTITISPFSESPIDKAFEECDRELTNIQNRNDILEKSNGTLLDANLDLCTKNRDLKNRLDKANSDRMELQKDRDILVRNNGEKQAEIAELKHRLDKANADRTELQKNLDYYMDIYKKVQDDYDDLHNKYSECQGTVDKQAEQIRNLKARLNSYCGIDYDKYIQRVQDNIRKNCYDQGQTDLWVKLQDVKDMQPNEFDTECECLGDVIDMDLEDFLDAYKKWWEEKEKERLDDMRGYLEWFCMGRRCDGCPLHTGEFKCGCGYSFKKATVWWDMKIIPDEELEKYYEKARGCVRYTLKDAKLFATTVEGVNRAITKACEGFCEAVKDADIKITENLCKGCTLEANVEVNKDLLNKVCGVKSEEEKPNPKGLVITTRGVTTANYSKATMNAIKEAVRKFEKSLPALDSWESTITGSIKVDDILGKTDNTEHKLEYGDAVRLPWRDYDYMYVGPYEESKTLVRMFDPKMHAMVTSHIGNVKYNGGKIIICDEEDLRKIWKYMK